MDPPYHKQKTESYSYPVANPILESLSPNYEPSTFAILLEN